MRIGPRPSRGKMIMVWDKEDIQMDRSIKRSKLFITLAAVTMIAIVAVFLITTILGVLSAIMGFAFPEVLNSMPVEVLMMIVLPVLSFIFSILAVIYSVKAKRIDRAKYGGRLVTSVIELCLVLGGALFVLFCYVLVETTGGA